MLYRDLVDLTALADRHGTDKGSFEGDQHLYTELYGAFFESFRFQKFNMLEMGLLRSPNRIEEADPAVRKVDRIPSVEMWLEFFSYAEVYGFDLADFSAFKKPRFRFLRGDLSRDEDLENLAKDLPKMRIIIDDASHAAFHQQRAFLKLFKLVEPGGFYVIEDLQYSPPFEHELPPSRKMSDIVEQYLSTNTLELDFGTAEEHAEIENAISHTFLHCSTRGRPDWGPKLVIFQKSGRVSAKAVSQFPAPGRSEIMKLLLSRPFCFRANNPDRVLCDALWFEHDGRISGYNNYNEAGWRLDDMRLLILRADGEASTVAKFTQNADGTVAFVGPFLEYPAVTHRFDEIKPQASELPTICTFDLFDTLVARRCQDPIAVFRNVETQSGVTDFARLRQSVESELWNRGDYDFEHVYNALEQATGWPNRILQKLRMMELAEEWNNLFPISNMIARVAPNDMIVSDMYLPETFLRRLLDEKCGLHGRGIHLSSHGKSSGKIWPKLLDVYRVRRHYGDNHGSDIDSARRAGIEAEHVPISSWTKAEKILIDLGLRNFAEALREARLSHIELDITLQNVTQAQFECNIPLLLLASIAVLNHAASENIDTILMCSRDCNLWIILLSFLQSRSGYVMRIRYLINSRILFLADSPEYCAYFDQMCGTRNLIVDISGTGRSPAHFLKVSGRNGNTSGLLVAGNHDVAQFVAELAPESIDGSVSALQWVPNDIRLTLESLNMSLDGRAMGMQFDGHEFTPIFEANEFGIRSRKLIRAMRRAFITSVDIMQKQVIELNTDISADILNHAIRALMTLCLDHQEAIGHIRAEILNNEQFIASRAKLEQERNRARSERDLSMPNG